MDDIYEAAKVLRDAILSDCNGCRGAGSATCRTCSRARLGAAIEDYMTDFERLSTEVFAAYAALGHALRRDALPGVSR